MRDLATRVFNDRTYSQSGTARVSCFVSCQTRSTLDSVPPKSTHSVAVDPGSFTWLY